MSISDDGSPNSRGHLVCRVAAEASEPEIDVISDQILPVSDNIGALRSVAVVDFGKITPDRDLARVGGVDSAGRFELSARTAAKPSWPLFNEIGILGRMIDDQVHHHTEPVPASGVGEVAQLNFRPAGAITQENRIDL